jgi:RNA polymerase sigma-70 factor (ECF subfamily)
MHAGEREAQNELLRRIGARMELLCRKMLNSFERLRSFEETGDVMTNACWRLLRSLESLKPANTREFFALAAEQVRRELLDLAKHHDANRRIGAAKAVRLDAADSSAPVVQIADEDKGPEELSRWTAFHEAIPQLPVEEREVFGLTFYHGWKQLEVAEVLHCDERTVRRRWHRACLLLKDLLGDEIPTL